MQKSIIKKGLVCIVIILFIGIAVAPSVTSIDISKTQTSNDDLVEITLQLCKTDGVEDHKMFITQEQDEQLGRLIESFKADLDKAETREETIEIYNDMVVSLDKLGILPEDTNYKEVQELVTCETSFNNLEKLISSKYFNLDYEKLKNKNLKQGVKENRFCLISGETTRTEAIGLCPVLPLIPTIFLSLRAEFISSILQQLFGEENKLEELYWSTFVVRLALWGSLILLIIIIPLKLIGFISFGDYYQHPPMEPEYYPARGWVSTNGLNGKITWEGPIYGHLGYGPKLMGGRYIGTVGFTGLKIIGKNFYQGTALRVKIGTSPPF